MFNMITMKEVIQGLLEDGTIYVVTYVNRAKQLEFLRCVLQDPGKGELPFDPRDLEWLYIYLEERDNRRSDFPDGSYKLTQTYARDLIFTDRLRNFLKDTTERYG